MRMCFFESGVHRGSTGNPRHTHLGVRHTLVYATQRILNFTHVFIQVADPHRTLMYAATRSGGLTWDATRSSSRWSALILSCACVAPHNTVFNHVMTVKSWSSS